MSLEKEKETYAKKFPELEEHLGEYVLIHGEEVAGIFEAYADAIAQGYRQFGLKPFLVKRIEREEGAQLITRILAPASTG